MVFFINSSPKARKNLNNIEKAQYPNPDTYPFSLLPFASFMKPYTAPNRTPPPPAVVPLPQYGPNMGRCRENIEHMCVRKAKGRRPEGRPSEAFSRERENSPPQIWPIFGEV
jgi:hypothetical protein